MLSVIIITKNEEKNIKACLESVKFADEIVVFDSGSSDNTLEICRQYTKKVFSSDWPGFGLQKQRALDKATGTWILSIDADERINKKLKEEILTCIKKTNVHGYYLPRLSYLCGKPIKHSGWYPDYIIRLFQKEHGQFTKDLVHEQIIINGPTEKLKNHILHYSYESLDQLIEKFNQYTSLGAEKLNQEGKTSSLPKALVRALFAFIKLYFLKKGFLDGKMGFVIAISSAESAYYKYLKLSLMEPNK